jgi:hypothetical protein
VHSLRYTVCSLTFLAAVAVAAPGVVAKNKSIAADQSGTKDEIQVVGHIALSDGPVSRFFTTQHYSSYYLYAEREAGRGVELIDVTNSSKPAVIGDVAYGAGSSDSLAVVSGTAALVTSAPATARTPVPATIRVMDFSEPRNLKVAREFDGVTAMSRDDRRGLIFLANAEGIWILKQHLAQDPEVEKAYANYVLYSH